MSKSTARWAGYSTCYFQKRKMHETGKTGLLTDSYYKSHAASRVVVVYITKTSLRGVAQLWGWRSRQNHPFSRRLAIRPMKFTLSPLWYSYIKYSLIVNLLHRYCILHINFLSPTLHVAILWYHYVCRQVHTLYDVYAHVLGPTHVLIWRFQSNVRRHGIYG